jgi:hypothetical protein
MAQGLNTTFSDCLDPLADGTSADTQSFSYS